MAKHVINCTQQERASFRAALERGIYCSQFYDRSLGSSQIPAPLEFLHGNSQINAAPKPLTPGNSQIHAALEFPPGNGQICAALEFLPGNSQIHAALAPFTTGNTQIHAVLNFYLGATELPFPARKA